MGDRPVQATTRYFISTDGAPLSKVSPPPKGFKVGNYKKGTGVGDMDYLRWHRENGNVWNECIHTKNRSTYTDRRTQIQAGWNVTVCNLASVTLIGGRSIMIGTWIRRGSWCRHENHDYSG